MGDLPFISPDDALWLAGEIDGLTDNVVTIRVSEWALKRDLPDELSPQPGPWSNDVAPYMVEVMDCMGESSPVRELAMMKGAQICATTAVLENSIGYNIDHSPCGMLFITADQSMAEGAIDVKVDRMLASCGLLHKMGPPVLEGRKTNKKTGDTSTRKDFPGGFLIAIGARSPGKMRQFSVKVALFDELDAFPDRLGGKSGKEGDPVQLAKTRTNAFEATRKILYLSTPLITQTSKILPLYEQGDQRRYFVPCIHCGVMQTLEWRILLEDGTRAGIVFDLDDAGNLVRDSVGYKCPHCRGVMRNHDKEIIMRLDKAEWRPTATSVRPDYRSYHISALYSPVGMRTWTAIVDDWLKAWDEVNDRVKDQELLKTHYNLDRGLPYEERGEAPKFEKIIGKRRAIYSQGEIPNVAAVRETGKHIALLTMAGDVHADRIDVEVLGWCEGGRSYSIEWLSLVGDTTDLDGPAWTAMAEMIETQVWLADDGKSYQPIMTFIDSQYRTDEVLTFCSEYNDQVMAIRGDHLPMRGARRREFSEFTSKSGTSGLQVTVTLYKDRLAGWLRREWEGEGIQPVGYPNYPRDYEDEYFRQYEREKKVKEINRSIGREVHKWVRTGDNHAFDCRVYNMAALDWIVYTTCLYAWGYDGIDYRAFWDGVYSDNMLNSWAD